jgi:hypothetical protein
MVVLVNATGHDVMVRGKDGSITVYPKSPISIRLSGADVREWSVHNVEIVQRRFYHESLPVPIANPGVRYIVSKKTAYAYANLRDDLIFPDTEDGAERDDAGWVTAVRRFRRPDKLEL